MSYPETLSHVLAKLEPDVSYEGCAHDKDFTPALQASLSIAISLRRIADALQPTNETRMLTIPELLFQIRSDLP